MLEIFRRRREMRIWARETAAVLLRDHGKLARGIIVLRMIERTRLRESTVLESLVKREIDRLNGTGPHVDTATRYHEDQR